MSQRPKLSRGEQKEMIEKLMANGMPITHIAKRIGCGIKTVRGILEGAESRRSRVRGEVRAGFTSGSEMAILAEAQENIDATLARSRYDQMNGIPPKHLQASRIAPDPKPKITLA